MNLVFFLEELSAKEALSGVLTSVLSREINIKYIVFQGKQDLEKQIERKIKNWLAPDTKFIILRDKDSGDCITIKKSLYEKCKSAEREDTLIRIACHELESWYLGDLEAVEKGLGISGLSKLQNGKYKTPDDFANSSQELINVTKKKYQKVSGSRAIAPYLRVDGKNRSHSFNVFIDGVINVANNRK